MKNRKLLWTFSILATSLSAQAEETNMKLINTRTGFVVVEFKDGAAHFQDRFLEAEMQDRGISIPEPRRADFGGKDTIYPGDTLFQKAFADIYVPLSIASPHYQWKP